MKGGKGAALEVRQSLLRSYLELARLAADSDEWIHSPIGADLWLDGLSAINAAAGGLFEIYLDTFLDFALRADHPILSLDPQELPTHLDTFDIFLGTCSKRDHRCFWPALAVGLVLAQASGGVPNIISSDTAIVNDTSLFVLSPNYRLLRVFAYNDGIRVRATSGKPITFRPELGFFVVAPPYLVHEIPDRVQYFNVNHDLAHIVLFGDAYLRPVGSQEITAALLLNAEETACAVDLILAADILRFRVDLHAFSELQKIEACWVTGAPGFFKRTARRSSRFVRYQAGLKAAAQPHLANSSPVSEQISACGAPADLADWIRPSAQEKHAKWCERLARRIWNPAFQRLVSLIPPQEQHLGNLLHFARAHWRLGEPVIPGRPPTLSSTNRTRGILLYQLRSIVIGAADLAVRLAEEGRASPTLLDDLTHWALTTVDDLWCPDSCDQDRFSFHAAALSAILCKHSITPNDRLPEPLHWP